MTLPLARRPAAVLFDCDGVLADSEGLVNRIVAEDLTARGWRISADEARETFLGLAGFAHRDLVAMCQDLRSTVARCTGIPTCVGIGPTKTLAKLANHIAKTVPALGGVCDLTDPVAYAHWLCRIAVAEVWGIGRASLAKLEAMGVESVADLRDLDPERVRAALPAERSAAWKALDVSVLHGAVVADLWQLTDTVETVAYEHDVPAALAAAARTGGTAVLLNPTPVDGVTAVAAGGERMPRKSTLFTPKPRTGLVVRDHRDA